jgi:D-inositol-3-phosphate glycosyltransferase
MHTSPLAQPGTGDGGGLNVYVQELSSALARAGVACDVYTRAFSPDLPAVVDVEPGFRVHHVAAGPLGPVAKEDLEGLVPEFAEAVLTRMGQGFPAEAIHANYWLSGVAGHTIKHRLDLPLTCTFHTLARVKAQADDDEPERRARAEATTIGCSEAVLASCRVEADQLIGLYHADPERIHILSPGVNHAFFAPGSRAGARRALGLDPDTPVVLFVGRIQPLKGLDVAVEAFSLLAGEQSEGAVLVVVGGPSGPDGPAHLAQVHELVERRGLDRRVRFVAPQPHEMLSSYYRAASVVLVPSRSESFGLVALEAAACGTPVVASAVGGLTTLVAHGETGFLVEERDPRQFAAAAAPILADAGLAASLSVEAARRAQRYRWSRTAARLRALYGELTDRVLVECR